MDPFAQSTHVHWIFNQNELESNRDELHKNAVNRVMKSFENEFNSSCTADFISVEEQVLMTRFYETKIRDYCKFFKFCKNTEATALLLFKRFFLVSSVMEFDAKLIL